MIGLNTQWLGIYSAYALCSPFFPGFLGDVPAMFLLDSSFSIYSHYFYPLVFLGNLKKTPFFITFVCAFFSFYDFTLLLIDVIKI